MYESRMCFLFTIFVARLQFAESVPQTYSSTDFISSSQHDNYNNQPASMLANSSSDQTTAPFSSHSAQPVPANSYYGPPLPPPPGQPDPYTAPGSYQQAPASFLPPQNFYQSAQQPAYYPPPYPVPASNPIHQSYSGSFSYDAHQPLPGSQAVQAVPSSNYPSASFHHLPPPDTNFQQALHASQQPHGSHQVAPAPTQLSYHLYAAYPGPPNQPVNSYPNPNYSYSYNMPHEGMGYNVPASSSYHPVSYVSRDSQATAPAKKVTTTTPRPKTATTSAPKPLEVELSIEDFFYLTQLQQMFNKSLDKQSLDLSSFSKASKKPGDDKDESPVFYGGVFDLEELSKIDNMKDFLEVFKKMEAKTQVARKDEETDPSDSTDDEERERGKQGNKRRKGSKSSSDATRTRHANRSKQKKKSKHADRADHGNEDEEEQEEEALIEEEADEESDTGDGKIGIGSYAPSSSQLDPRHKKKRINTSQATSTTTAAPVAMYPNPYVYSFPYNYQQLQQQYMQQLAAMSGQSLPLRSAAEKEATKYLDEEPLASPNENRNVINVNIADPHKAGDNVHNDRSPNQDIANASQGMRFPLRRGSFNSMANSLAKKALSSILYRIFPTMKHLNVKGVAAKGCRDVQSIGSLDSIIMPLGLAVTLHPLLLPLVPFLLLALGSIKAIESATCFVSEYFA